MRNWRYALLLALLLAGVGVVIWFPSRVDAPINTTAQFEDLTGTVSDDEDSLTDKPLSGDTGISEDPQPDPAAESGWTLRGQLVFGESDMPAPERHAAPKYWKLAIWQRTSEGTWTSVANGNPDDDWTFNLAAPDVALDHEWGVSLAAGEVSSPVMPAPAPAVFGRDLDFGNVLMELNALYESGMFLRGRLVHSSGRAVAYSQGIALRLDDPEVKVDDDWDPRLVDLWTNGRGEFEVFVKALTPEQLAAFEVYVCSPEIVEYYSYAAGTGLEARGAVRVSGTTVTGQVADLGTISLGGSLIELVFELEGNDSRALDETDYSYGLRGEGYVLVYATPFDEQFELSFDLPVTRPGCMLWVHEGSYRLNSLPRGFSGFYTSDYRPLEVPDGVVLAVEVNLRSLASVPVEIEYEGEPPESVWLRGSVDDDEVAIASFRTDWQVGLRVPVEPGRTTSVRASANGFETLEFEVHSTDTVVRIKLVRVSELALTLIVTVPEGPPGLDWQAAAAVLQVSNDGTSWKNAASVTGPGEFQILVREPGDWEVRLAGGRLQGYASNVLTGPVSAPATKQGATPVILPAIAAPPWAVPAGSIQWDVTCEGRPLKRVEAAVETADGPRWEKILPGQNVAAAALPVAVRHASVSAPERELPVTLVPPAEAGGVAYLKLDFPATIKVRMSNQGSPEVAFFTRCTYSRADAIDGVAHLWCPQYELTVSGYAQEWSARRRVSVTGDGVLELELTAEADGDTPEREVEFTVTEDGTRRRASMTTDAPPPWTLYRMTEHGLSVEGKLEPDEDSQSVTRNLEAGTYVAIANYGQPRARHRFDVDTSTRETLKIRLPELKGYAVCDVKFVFSRSTHGEDLGYHVSFQSYLADKDAQPQPSGWRDYESRRVPDGLVLCGLTEGDVHVLQLRAYDEDETVVALSRPVLVTAQREVQVVHVTWQPLIPLHSEWWYIGAYYRSEWPGYRVYLGSSVPGGPLTLEFVDDLKTLHTATVDFPHTAVPGGFRIPAELREKLIELELLEPDDD